MYSDVSHVSSRRATVDDAPRTAILVRCEEVEAERIREAARRRAVPINSFVLQSLRWSLHTRSPVSVTGTANTSTAP